MRNLKCNIDADLVAYEVAVCGEYIDETGEKVIKSYRSIEDLTEIIVNQILEAVGSTLPPTMFLTGDGNFRFDIATVKPYKGNRKAEDKPYHLENVRVVMQSLYETVIAHDCEADDELAMAQTENTVLCSRDKDLKQVGGYHYGWEVGLQPEQPLHLVEGMGVLLPKYKEVTSKKGVVSLRMKKLDGEGYIYFLSQILTGDVVDNIPGCPNVGIVKAYERLSLANTKREAIRIVQDIYEECYGEGYVSYLQEQAQLVWMVRGRDEDGKLIMWRLRDAKICETFEM